jgi:hypothetical protein
MTGTTPPPRRRPTANAGRFSEVGVAGLKVASGYVYEEFLPQLRGRLAAVTYREMSDNDATVGAVLIAVELLSRAVVWRVDPADDSAEADEAAEFAKSLLDDMSHTWEDFIAEAMTMLVYGWSYHEIVLKRRVGPDQTDPTRRSRYTDGKIGIRKLAPRAQETLVRWEMQEDGGIAGLVQMPPYGGGERYIPIDRALLFRTTTRKNNPEGRSVLRNAYRSWYILRTIQDVEAVGIERELAGLPVVSIPTQYLTSTRPEDQAVRVAYEKIARDLKFNEQGGLVIPSDTFPNTDGSPSSVPLVTVRLLSTAGSRAIDTSRVVTRYQTDIARTVLADFVLLGQSERGSFALSKNKTDLFLRAIEVFLNQIAAVLNRHLLSRIWAYNSMDPATIPTLVPGRVSPVDLGELGKFLSDLSGAGAQMFPDDELEAHLRDVAGLPAKSTSSEVGANAGDGMAGDDDGLTEGQPDDVTGFGEAEAFGADNAGVE